MNVSHLARAIANGVEENMFSLPKGPAGKVKLFKPKPAAASTTKEVPIIQLVLGLIN